jgi:3-hydroxybutyryl-CoA dehydrogenase
MPYTLPGDVNERPIAVDGAGTLGRRIASVFASGGTDVRIFDASQEQLESAHAFVLEDIGHTQQVLDLHPSRIGNVTVSGDLGETVRGAWLVIEAVPEQLELKKEVFGQLDRLADADAILASNSSSLPTGSMIDKVAHPERVLNTHFMRPPELNGLELMSCGKTDEAILDALMDRLPQYGLMPFRCRRESDGFIFNRIWASIKRECLMVVEEGVAAPEDVDGMWKIFTSVGIPPFRMMDRVGLDVVLDIEEHYAAVRAAIPEGPRELLRAQIEQGRLGEKSGRGFYDYSG